MCIKTQTSRFTGSSWAQLERLAAALQKADAVLVGAGAGLSTSAGVCLQRGSGSAVTLGTSRRPTASTTCIPGGILPLSPNLGGALGLLEPVYLLNRYCDPPKPVYQNLLELVKEKDTFVLTTNVDHCFQKAGFDKRRLFYTQGDYGLWQCSKPCHDKTYDNQEAVRQMVEAQGFQVTERGLLPPAQPKRAVPTELVPRCPVCGAPMSMNLRADNTFVQDDGWYQAAQRYEWFLRSRKELRVVFLELGGGVQHPGGLSSTPSGR